jgi:hypothetical protein
MQARISNHEKQNLVRILLKASLSLPLSFFSSFIVILSMRAVAVATVILVCVAWHAMAWEHVETAFQPSANFSFF